MSKRRDLEAALRSLGEIRDILNAMKNMARMEVHRLGRYLETQRRVVASIESAAADFRHFYPEMFETKDGHDVLLIAGSERGFCGDFNESLVRAFAAQPARPQTVVILGSKLQTRLAGRIPEATLLESVSVADEIEGLLIRLMDKLSGLHGLTAASPLRLTALHHHTHGEPPQLSVLYPFEDLPDGSRFAYPPGLLLNPMEFVSGLVDQYLFARLHEVIYRSLMIENQARLEHMDAAVQRLDRKSTDLFRRRNVLRQEEITEEIEIIMLSAGLASS